MHPARHVRTFSAAAAAAIVLGACSSGGDDVVPAPPDGATSTKDVTTEPSGEADASKASMQSPGKDYPVAAGGKAVPEDVLGTKEAMGYVFNLTGVRRVSEDRVLVQGVLDGKGENKTNFGVFVEPGYKDGSNSEFSAVTVTKSGDSTVYLPVRDDKKQCLCTVLTPSLLKDKNAVQVLMSAPKGADTLTVTVSGIGSFPNVKVTS